MPDVHRCGHHRRCIIILSDVPTRLIVVGLLVAVCIFALLLDWKEAPPAPARLRKKALAIASDAWTDADIRGPMEIMAHWASTTGAGMPVFIGEWGVGWHSRLASMNCNNVRLFYSRFHQVHATEMHMPTAVWDDGGWFQVYDHATNSFPHNLVECIDGACSWAGQQRFNADCL